MDIKIVIVRDGGKNIVNTYVMHVDTIIPDDMRDRLRAAGYDYTAVYPEVVISQSALFAEIDDYCDSNKALRYSDHRLGCGCVHCSDLNDRRQHG